MSQLDRGKIKWRCRRGVKELDVLLERFMEQEFDAASADEQKAFAELLTLPDPQLLDYLTGRAIPPGATGAHVIERLRASR